MPRCKLTDFPQLTREIGDIPFLFLDTIELRARNAGYYAIEHAAGAIEHFRRRHEPQAPSHPRFSHRDECRRLIHCARRERLAAIIYRRYLKPERAIA